jgi:hypothetical protein
MGTVSSNLFPSTQRMLDFAAYVMLLSTLFLIQEKEGISNR